KLIYVAKIGSEKELFLVHFNAIQQKISIFRRFWFHFSISESKRPHPLLTFICSKYMLLSIK
ncbi:hypothetical protein, partial [Bacteroides sp.]|uniref:hypothetical protein n=1 Tax=Bacteroides sp. TaxID=29523 RepID=UPI002FCA40DD